jgi:hypothetical protein
VGLIKEISVFLFCIIAFLDVYEAILPRCRLKRKEAPGFIIRS